MQKKYKCVILDLDGTMLNTERMNLIPLQRVIKEELGKDIAYEDLVKYVGYAGEKTLDLLGFPHIERAYDLWVKYVNAFEEGATLYEGWIEVTEALDRQGIICAIASSKSEAQYEIDFLPTGLQQYMKCAVLADHTSNHKPHPEPLLKAAELLGVAPAEAIYVGDTVFDAQAAKAAGMDFAFARWAAFSVDGIEAAYHLETPRDLLDVFMK